MQPAPSARSTFVSVLAWAFIGLSAVATCMSLLQNVMVNLLFPAFEMDLARVTASGRLPSIARVVIEHVRLFLAVYLLLSAATLVSSIGLLQRKEWARVAFIALMGIGIATNVGGVALSFAFFSAVPDVTPMAPPPFGDQARVMVGMIMGINLLFTAALILLFGWIIKRLRSAEVRTEFISS